MRLRLLTGVSGYILLLFFFQLMGQTSSAQNSGKITGMVTDSLGKGIPNVTVTEKGSKNSTATARDGSFVINTSKSQPALLFTAVDFETKEVAAGMQTTISVQLHHANKAMEEVVVIGYGTQKKENITSAVASVKSKDFVKAVNPDAAQLIRGKVAGLTVVTPDANPLSTSQISLRGANTLASGSTPLILIDGIPGNLNTVSPNDIEQIDVLKDGSAAAIYGTRGTNGVILITTKKAKGAITPTIEINSYVSIQKILKKLPTLTADEYIEKAAQGTPGALNLGSKTDWVNEILQTPVNQTYNVSLKGGSQNTNYVASFDYTSNEGLIKLSKVDMIFPRLNIVHRMFENKLKIEASLNGYQQKWGIPYNGAVYNNALIYNPTSPVKDSSGKWKETARDVPNPLALLYEARGENKQTNFRMFSTATLTPINGLDIKYLISQETYNYFAGYYETKQHRTTVIGGLNGYASRTTNRTQNDLMEVTAQYSKILHNTHNLNFLVGHSWIRNNFQSAYMANNNFPSNDYSYNNMGLGAALRDGIASQSSFQGENTLISYFGRLNYSFKGKYIVQASIRREGSSKFGADHKWGTFPAISVGWNLKNESFLDRLNSISTLKLRAGYGVTGTEPGSSYLSLSTLNFGGFGYYAGQWVNLLRPGSNPNPDLRWEKKEEINVGLDFGFFNDRISGSIDVYNRDTKDLIWSYTVPVPPYLYPSITANAGSIRNRGLEVALNFIPVTNKDFTWNSNVNFSTNRNTLLSLSNDKFISAGFADAGNTLAPIQQPTHRIQEGEAIGNFYGYKSTGIDDNGRWIIAGADGNPKPIAQQQPKDKKVLGNGIPKYYLNWNNSLTFKQFDLGLTMRGALGFQILNSAEMNYGVPVALINGNIMAKAFDNVYGKRQLANNQELQYVSHFIQDGDYWKIDNLTIGYTPNFGANKWVKNIRVYGSVANLAVITNYTGIDPEVNIQGLTPGTDDRFRYPSARTFTLGVNAIF